jgi:hypothetical protein
MNPNENQAHQNRKRSLSGKLIDYQACPRRNDGERPSDDLETDHAGESNSGRVEVPGLNKIPPEQRRKSVQNSTAGTWNMEKPPHQTDMRKTN